MGLFFNRISRIYMIEVGKTGQTWFAMTAIQSVND